MQIGDSLKIQVWRKGKLHNLNMTLKAPPFGNEMRNSYDKLPEYLIFGGLVFTTLNRNYINLQGNMSPSLAYEHWYRELELPGTRNDQAIVIAKVLPASVNSGYTNYRNYIVNSLNGNLVNTLVNLKNMLGNLPANTIHIVFESEWHDLPLVLNYKESIKQGPKILRNYGIMKNSNLYSENFKNHQ